MNIKQIVIQVVAQVLQEKGSEYVADLQQRLAGQGLGDSNLATSISFNVSGQVLTINMAEYADFVDKGRAAGKFPPPNAIQDWVRRKGLTMSDGSGNLEQNQKSLAFLIGRKIANEGTPAQPFIKPTPEDDILNEIQTRLEQRIYNEIME